MNVMSAINEPDVGQAANRQQPSYERAVATIPPPPLDMVPPSPSAVRLRASTPAPPCPRLAATTSRRPRRRPTPQPRVAATTLARLALTMPPRLHVRASAAPASPRPRR